MPTRLNVAGMVERFARLIDLAGDLTLRERELAHAAIDALESLRAELDAPLTEPAPADERTWQRLLDAASAPPNHGHSEAASKPHHH